MSIADVTALIDEHFPQAREDVGAFVIESISGAGARLRLPIRDSFIRPGGSVSGPTMFKLADLGIYAAILGQRGPAALQAVTSNMTINFLARPEPHDLICEVELLRLGRRLAVAQARLWTDGRDALVCHATGTYALPST
ncbi:MAG: PaaI family thioesterase [Hyphomicrobiaceae bacterium]|nr:PaaI family thioesterase [Hyphomicrobiaceae bacterium]